MPPLLMMALDDATKTMPIRVPRMDGRGIATVSAAAVQPYRIAPCSTVPSSAAQLEGPGTIRADLCTLEHRSATKVLFVCLSVCLFVCSHCSHHTCALQWIGGHGSTIGGVIVDAGVSKISYPPIRPLSLCRVACRFVMRGAARR